MSQRHLLKSALHEMYAVSQGTRAKRFMFSLSLTPPGHDTISIDESEAAIEATEVKLGLPGATSRHRLV